MAKYIILNLKGIHPKIISRKKSVKEKLDRCVNKSDFKYIKSFFHQFRPFGVTGIYMLRESHISIHTWPEKGFAVIDVFCCGDIKRSQKFIEYIKKEFKPTKIKKSATTISSI